jgi:hypothetical protein
MALIVNLPALNGEFTCGLAVGSDAQLAADEKLPIFANIAQDMSKASTLRYLFRKYKTQARLADEIVAIYLNAAAALYDANLLASDDGDSQICTEAPLTDTTNDVEIMGHINQESLVRVATLIVATKAHWWNSNHHVGQGEITGYPAKVKAMWWSSTDNAVFRKAAHTTGHWASTRAILIRANIDGIKDVNSYANYTEKGVVRLGDDAMRRFGMWAAGTHRVAVAYAALSRLVNHICVLLMPNTETLQYIVPTREAIAAAPASYHIGAMYLTGSAKLQYDEGQIEATLGRLGTFVTTVYKKSTLAKSPHFTAERISSYEDYDDEFLAKLNSFVIRSAKRHTGLVSIFEKTSAAKNTFDEDLIAQHLSMAIGSGVVAFIRQFQLENSDDNDKPGPSGGSGGGGGKRARLTRSEETGSQDQDSEESEEEEVPVVKAKGVKAKVKARGKKR